MQHSEQINELAAALAKAQGEIEGASKSSANPHFKSKYADLAACWDACRAPLSKNGLAVVQMPSHEEGVATVTTLLTHSSGQWMRSEVSVKPGKPDAQGLGSAITYLRRYALMAVVGIAPEDDDGNAAVAQDQSGVRRPEPRPTTQQPDPDDGTPLVVKWARQKWAAGPVTLDAFAKMTDEKQFEGFKALVHEAPTLEALEEFSDACDGIVDHAHRTNEKAHRAIIHALDARRQFFAQHPTGKAA
jgi:hypothetical protein